jgi:small subunit ribosomal protein S6
MRRYETIVIIDPDVSEDDRTSLFTRVKEIIPQQEGVLLFEDLWGPRKLAYAIKKKPRGFYARYDYCGMGPLVDELERSLRIDDRVFKYLTVQLDDDADVEKIQAEIAAAQIASEAAAAPVAPVAPVEATDATPPESNDSTAETVVAEPATDTSEKE